MSASVRALLPTSRFKIVGDSYYRRIVATLPEPYQKFWAEWKDREPIPIHWIPRKEKWERDPETGVTKPIQNEPIPVVYPNEAHTGLWGGEGVVEGLIKKAKYRSPVPRFWVPSLKKTVVYSEVLDKHFSVIVTERALSLIDYNHGLDSYLLKTPACDLQSFLAFKLKRIILLDLIDKNFWHDDAEKQEELLEKHKPYLIPRDEADWYGLTVEEAQAKWAKILKAQNIPQPLKFQLRQKLIRQLKEDKLNPQEDTNVSKSWMSRINPFSKPSEVEK